MATIRFGDTTPLRPHTGSRLKKMATSPAPGDYDVQGKEETKFKRYPASQFGGRMCGVDRERTGIRASALQHMDDPGPHSYSAAAGQQKLKVQPRSQTTKFGSSDRSSTCRLYIHKNDVSGNDTHPNRLSAGRDVPGPGTYEILEAWTRSRSDRNFTFGIKTSRTQENITATTERIGPGAYHQPSSFGPQLLSKRPTTPGFSIGGSTQGEVQKIRERQSRQSPGPTEYDAPTGIGKQQFVSTKPTASSFSFGSTSKLQRPKSRIPGPAKYEFTSMLGLQSISQHRSYGGFKFGTSRRPDTASQLAQTSGRIK